MAVSHRRGLYLILVTVHGLVRGRDMELGQDADTGGQIKYVLELARALAAHDDVERVDVLTRQVIDSKISPDYAEPVEELAPGAQIIRLPCGPRRYLRKEVLWPYLDSLADQALKHIRRVGRIPDVIHAHYADAGYIGRRLCSLLEVPLVFTGHSMGRVKLQRLKANGVSDEQIERQYHIGKRIEAEESALDLAELVITSTKQEVEEQYVLYDNNQPQRMVVIPPGVDLESFYPPRRGKFKPAIYEEISRFLHVPERPMILALSRADPRKNIAALMRAYAETPGLRDKANLVIVAGNRGDIRKMEKGARQVLTELIMLIDRYDLYGHVAMPKQHEARDVGYLYRLAAKSRGVFVNPALTEPFGLTLLEAAASGLPMIATEDGGPKDILNYCNNGYLIDPLDTKRMGEIILDVLSNQARWKRWSKSGLNGVRRHFSWSGHAHKYVREVVKRLPRKRRSKSAESGVRTRVKGRLATADRILVCDVDHTLIGDEEALRGFVKCVREAGNRLAFGVVSGRQLESTRTVLRRSRVPEPDFYICATGTEISYAPMYLADDVWRRNIDNLWEPKRVHAALEGLPGLKLQPDPEQSGFKISYFFDGPEPPSQAQIKRMLRKQDLHAEVIISHDFYVDILPVRASKGAALRFVADKWGIPVEHILAAGDSGNDEDMLAGETLGVVVGNHSPELEVLRGRERIYFAEGEYAAGILEAMNYYDFLGSPRDPDPDMEG